MNQLNRKLAPEIESIYIFASAQYSFLSSTGVKEMATFGGDVSDLVPTPVAGPLAERLRSASRASAVRGQELAERRRNAELHRPSAAARVSFSALQWTYSYS